MKQIFRSIPIIKKYTEEGIAGTEHITVYDYNRSKVHTIDTNIKDKDFYLKFIITNVFAYFLIISAIRILLDYSLIMFASSCAITLILFIIFSMRAFKKYTMYKIGKNYWKSDNFFIVEEKNWAEFKGQNQFGHIENKDDDIISWI